MVPVVDGAWLVSVVGGLNVRGRMVIVLALCKVWGAVSPTTGAVAIVSTVREGGNAACSLAL